MLKLDNSVLSIWTDREPPLASSHSGYSYAMDMFILSL